MAQKPPNMKLFRTQAEQQVGKNIQQIFNDCPDSIEIKLQNFPKYVRRQHLKRFLALYELFKQVLPIKGSVVECGVFRGFGVMSWAKLSAILEPENLTRRVYGFDTFRGFPSVVQQDKNRFQKNRRGLFGVNHNHREELLQLLEEYDSDRFLGHINKVELIAGDIVKTVPAFIKKNQHLIISLLFIDCDLFEPTKMALEHFVPRMPRGAILAFDELDNPIWPGETVALLKTLGINSVKLQRIEWDPYISYVVIQ